MQKTLTPPERLIVAADFKPTSPNGCERVGRQVLALARSLEGTGVYLKVNSALRACGYGLIEQIRQFGLRVFADLKLVDIPNTLATDGALLEEMRPELLTTMCVAGVAALRSLKAELPDTEVLGVTALTSLIDADTKAMFACSTEEVVLRFAQVAVAADIDGLISSAKEVEALRARFGTLLSLNAAGIRPAWSIVPGDDQNPKRIMTPSKAIRAGVDRIVVGRPITNPPPGLTPRGAVLQTIDEIKAAMTEPLSWREAAHHR
jgi:orotidine-5'-phosphate decarboxylase